MWKTSVDAVAVRMPDVPELLRDGDGPLTPSVRHRRTRRQQGEHRRQTDDSENTTKHFRLLLMVPRAAPKRYASTPEQCHPIRHRPVFWRLIPVAPTHR
jgi:hypothetical protein